MANLNRRQQHSGAGRPVWRSRDRASRRVFPAVRRRWRDRPMCEGVAGLVQAHRHFELSQDPTVAAKSARRSGAALTRTRAKLALPEGEKSPNEAPDCTSPGPPIGAEAFARPSICDQPLSRRPQPKTRTLYLNRRSRPHHRKGQLWGRQATVSSTRGVPRQHQTEQEKCR